MIQNIEISKLHPHPDNPRKDLGDLTELAESIKQKGILQNLTVVELKNYEKGYYRIVIGHRRFEAAKMAGLTELPCIVSDMDYHDQLATMLLENIQRNDLTIYEQAQGFQMMMKFGDTVEVISKRTGFSETTVRRRVKLLELDADKFKKSIERGATLMDYIELEKIHDIKLRNSVLDKIGTNNFKWELQQAIEKEKSEKNKALIIAGLEKFAKQVKDGNGLQYVKYYPTSQETEITIPDDADSVEYFFEVSSYGSVTLYKKCGQSKSNSAQDNQNKESDQRRNNLSEITKRAYQLRREFILDFSNARAKKNIEIIMEYSVRALCGFDTVDLDDFAGALNMETDDDEELIFDNFSERVKKEPDLHLLIATYIALDSGRESYYTWNGQYNDNEDLNAVYEFLEKLGYEMSEEECMLQLGTHKLFAPKDAEK